MCVHNLMNTLMPKEQAGLISYQLAQLRTERKARTVLESHLQTSKSRYLSISILNKTLKSSRDEVYVALEELHVEGEDLHELEK